MGYLDDINLDKPADSDLLSEGDDAVRQNFRAMWQRFSNLVQDPDADPLVIKRTALAFKKISRVLHLAFQPQDNTLAIVRSLTFTTPNDAISLVLYGQCQVDAGLQLNTARIAVEITDPASAIVGSLYRVGADGTQTHMCSFAADPGVAGMQVLEADVPYAVLDGDTFMFLIALNATVSSNTALLYWAEIENE